MAEKKRIIKKKPEPKEPEPAKRGQYIRQRFPGGQREVRRKKQDDAYDHVVVELRRTAKVLAGGKRMGFSAFVAVGNRDGSIGIALGKAPDPRSAVSKAQKRARKNMIKVYLPNNTLPYEMEHTFKAAKVFIRPAHEGTGLIAGGSVRIMLDLVGVKNASAKIYGTNNKITNAYCVFEMLKKYGSTPEKK